MEKPWDDQLGVIGFLDNVRVRFRERDSGDDNLSTPSPPVQVPWDAEFGPGGVSTAHHVQATFAGGRYEFLFGVGKVMRDDQ